MLCKPCSLQALLNGLNPSLANSKFRDLANVRADSRKFANLVALEDWLNYGVPIARECIFDWCVKNTPERGHWTISGTTVDPTKLDQPALAVFPKNDYIVPPARLGLSLTLRRMRPCGPASLDILAWSPVNGPPHSFIAHWPIGLPDS